MTVSSMALMLKRAKMFRVNLSNKKKGLTLNQLTVLFILEDIKDNNRPGLNVTQLAAVLDCAIGTASQVLKRMEEQKLIARKIVRVKMRGRTHIVPKIMYKGSKAIEAFMQ